MSDPLEEAFDCAINQYKECGRRLSECEIDIEVARMRKDTDALRQALSLQNRLAAMVDEAKHKVREAALDRARGHGLVLKAEKTDGPGLVQKILTKIMQS